MPQKVWSAKRERQYAHVKESLIDRRKSLPLAEEIAARVVNKERAQHGESVEASAFSVNDMPPGVVADCARIRAQVAARCDSFATRRASVA